MYLSIERTCNAHAADTGYQPTPYGGGGTTGVHGKHKRRGDSRKKTANTNGEGEGG